LTTAETHAVASKPRFTHPVRKRIRALARVSFTPTPVTLTLVTVTYGFRCRAEFQNPATGGNVGGSSLVVVVNVSGPAGESDTPVRNATFGAVGASECRNGSFVIFTKILVGISFREWRYSKSDRGQQQRPMSRCVASLLTKSNSSAPRSLYRTCLYLKWATAIPDRSGKRRHLFAKTQRSGG
jgi:hypothetical protein